MEVFGLEEIQFYECYRALIRSYSMSRDQSEAQLAAILRRVRARAGPQTTHPADPAADRRKPT